MEIAGHQAGLEEKTPAMKTIIVGMAAGAAALALHGTPVAHADCTAETPCQGPGPTHFYTGPELDYLSELDRFHIPYTDSPAAATTGHTLCELELDASTTRVQDNWTVSLTRNQAAEVKMAAEEHLCP